MTMTATSPDRHRHTRPQSARLHHFSNGAADFILDVEGGRVMPLSAGQNSAIESALRLGDPVRAEVMALGAGLLAPTPDVAVLPKNVPLKALSLSVAQKCNLGCTYCYAQQGTFGGKAGDMPAYVARASIDQLLDGAKPGENVTLAFMGGEPLTNRKTLHASTKYAAKQAAAGGVGIGFTMTTNATLLRLEDINLFQKYRFTLTISVDGLQGTNDQLRPFVSGRGSFDRVMKNVSRLLEVSDRSFQVLARVTVTPKNLDLPEIMSGLLDLGFDGIMFSPMLSAPSGKEEMQTNDLDLLLEQLIRCGDFFRNEIAQGRILPFTNVVQTLQRIHRYQRNQYPCGAGGGYMGVSADGELYACHRFVNDDQGHMGDVDSGVDLDKQALWLDDRHLQKQNPCNSCWARYLCSGSCHYEAIKRGRPACDYIRGWLHYCLTIYTELLRNDPDTLEKILTLD